MTRADEISNLLEQKENVKEFNELDFKITPDELHAATVSLKNNKAVGFDSISNEMLKAGYGALHKNLLKLFNCILCNGDYPTEWKSTYITPVHKGGSPDDPNNYRGISILSCIAKLFNTILTRRLDNFLEQKNIISPLQIGLQRRRALQIIYLYCKRLLKNTAVAIMENCMHVSLIFIKPLIGSFIL